VEDDTVGARFWRIYEKANAVVRTFTGPAQLGAGYDEAPVEQGIDRGCPICGVAMSRHELVRSDDQRTSTRLICPPAG
jgi:hypothetical protein